MANDRHPGKRRSLVERARGAAWDCAAPSESLLKGMIEAMINPETCDDYGIPSNMFGAAGDFYEIVGRVTMCAALLEDRLAHLVQTLEGQLTTPQDEHAGKYVRKLLPLVVGAVDGRDDQAAMDCREFAKRAEAAFEARNHIVHNLWPSPARGTVFGWRQQRRPKRDGGGFVMVQVEWTREDLRGQIQELVALYRECRRLEDVALRASEAPGPT